MVHIAKFTPIPTFSLSLQFLNLSPSWTFEKFPLNIPWWFNNLPASIISCPHGFEHKSLFLWSPTLFPFQTSLMRQWSDIDIEEWKTLASGNRSIQSLLATALSNLSLVLSPPYRPLHYVYFCPIKPRSTKPHLFKQSLKSTIFFASRISLPNFSLEYRISLKSPKTTQGKLHCLLSELSNCQETYLLLVSGWP